MRKKSEIETAFAPRDALAAHRSFFLVGIGGAGMAGVAEMLLSRGLSVKGTDAVDSSLIDHLRSLGAEVSIGHGGERVESGDAMILTDAIDLETSPEVARARALGVPLFRRSQALGWLLADRKVIAVTGTHGKTTTTGMIGAGLRAAGLDPLIVVGAEVPDFGGSVVFGSGEYAVVEACEAYDSFHDLDPFVAVLTNLEPDHLDYHGTPEALNASVEKFLARASHVVYCSRDEGARAMGSRLGGEDYDFPAIPGLKAQMTAPGEHNFLNAGAAIRVAELIGADVNAVAGGVGKFSGAARRLQVIHEGSVTILDDYAHHPTEVDASIAAIRERFPNRRLCVVFQPHLYTRTRDFLNEFAESLSKADIVVLTDIYPAREEPLAGITSGRIAEAMTCPVKLVPSRHALVKEVKKLLKPGDVVVGMGAGNIGEFAPLLAADLTRTGPLRVWVAYGGDSPEREVSLHSGRQVHAALVRRGYDAKLVDFSEILLNPVTRFPQPKPDVVVLAVHGTHAEDGAIQGLCELMQIPYTGSGIQASAIAMDKDLTKTMLKTEGVKVPHGQVIRSLQDTVHLPGVERFVVKPNAQGSTVGLTFVDDPKDLKTAIEKALTYSPEALVEEWLEGVEISVPCLKDRALPAVEVVPPEGKYDYAAKYLPGATEEICPARIGQAAAQKAADYAVRCHEILGCAGATRTDMIVNGDDVTVIEVNTLPGMTATSLLPLCAKVAGIAFDDLCEWLVKDAMERHA